MASVLLFNEFIPVSFYIPVPTYLTSAPYLSSIALVFGGLVDLKHRRMSDTLRGALAREIACKLCKKPRDGRFIRTQSGQDGEGFGIDFGSDGASGGSSRGIPVMTTRTGEGKGSLTINGT